MGKAGVVNCYVDAWVERSFFIEETQLGIP